MLRWTSNPQGNPILYLMCQELLPQTALEFSCMRLMERMHRNSVSSRLAMEPTTLSMWIPARYWMFMALLRPMVRFYSNMTVTVRLLNNGLFATMAMGKSHWCQWTRIKLLMYRARIIRPTSHCSCIRQMIPLPSNGSSRSLKPCATVWMSRRQSIGRICLMAHILSVQS